MNLDGIKGETGINTHSVILDLWRRLRKIESRLSLLQVNNEFQIDIEGLNGMCVIRSTTEPPVPNEACIWIKTGGSTVQWFTHSGKAGQDWYFWKTD